MTEALLRAALRLGGSVRLRSRRTERVWEVRLNPQGKLWGESQSPRSSHMSHKQLAYHLRKFPENFHLCPEPDNSDTL